MEKCRTERKVQDNDATGFGFTMEDLLPLVEKLVRKYTGCDSTSVTYEKASQLMEAILYCIREYEKTGQNTVFSKAVSATEAYEAGYRLVIDKVGRLMELYNSHIESFHSYGNRCLYDTVVKGIPEFFKWYDPKFCPQDTILTLDYPILKDIRHLSGVDALWEYTEYIFQEQTFLQQHTPDRIQQILSEYSPEYRDMIENVGDIVRNYEKKHSVCPDSKE